jgi:hypothetical protein
VSGWPWLAGLFAVLGVYGACEAIKANWQDAEAEQIRQEWT